MTSTWRMTSTRTADDGPVSPRAAIRPRPRIGPHVRGWSFRLATAAVGGSLAVALLSGPLLWLALVLLAIGCAVPRIPTVWAASFVLSTALLAGPADALDWRRPAVVAGVHLLHLAASFSMVVPLADRVALAALATTLRRFVLLQIPVQLAALALALLDDPIRTAVGGRDGSIVVAATGVAVVVVAVVAGSTVATRHRVRRHPGGRVGGSA